MKTFTLIFLLLLASSAGRAQIEAKPISLDGRISLSTTEGLVAQNPQNNLPPGYNGSYRPVAPQPQQAPCGGFSTAPCTGAVIQNTGPSAERLFIAAKQASANHQPQQSIDYLTRSAQMGYRAAQYALGDDYQKGNGVPRDLRQAKYWLGLAAQQGSTTAQGQLRTIDPANSMKYLQMGADQRDPQSEFDLGVAYELGHGVPHDRAKAIRYLQLATQHSSNPTGDRIAAALSRTSASRRFPSQQALMAFAPAPPQPRTPGVPANCPAWYDSSNIGTAGEMMTFSRSFCLLHPNCTFKLINDTFQCHGDQTPMTFR